jgi:hypothetical protein
MTINGIGGQTAAPITAPSAEEAREIRSGTTEEAAAGPQPAKTAEQTRGLGTLIDTKA